MNNFKNFTLITSIGIFLAISINFSMLKISNSQAEDQVQTFEVQYPVKKQVSDNLAYFQGEKWNIVIPIATLGILSTILGMTTMMLIESRLKVQNNSYRKE